jgi:Domain of unknown function (DUF4397)
MKKRIFGSIIIAAFIVFACKKNDTIPNRTTLNPPDIANIKGIHLSPDAPLFNIMVDSIRALTVIETADNVESGLGFGTVVPSLSNGYSIVPSGTHTVSAKVPSTSATLPNQTIVSKSTNFVAGKYYTIVVGDSLSKLDAVIIEDDLNVPDTSKAYIRILNFMMKGSADLEFQGSAGGYNFNKNGIPFKSVSNFDTLTQGTYKIYLRATGSATKLDSITAFAPLKGRKYTLYTRGVVGQTGSTNTKRPLVFQIQNL